LIDEINNDWIEIEKSIKFKRLFKTLKKWSRGFREKKSSKH